MKAAAFGHLCPGRWTASQEHRGPDTILAACSPGGGGPTKEKLLSVSWSRNKSCYMH